MTIPVHNSATSTGQIGNTPIPGARLFVDVSGELYYKIASKDDTFSLDVPEEDRTLLS